MKSIPPRLSWDRVEVGPDLVELGRVAVGDEPARVAGYEVGFDGCNSSSFPAVFKVESHGEGEPILMDQFYVPAYGGYASVPFPGRGKKVDAGRSIVVKASHPNGTGVTYARGCIVFARD